MKFKFTIQPYQTEAVESVVKVFEGQPGADSEGLRVKNELLTRYANRRVLLSDTQLLKNIREIQQSNNVYLSREIIHDGLGACSLDVEMETGTGKTYVYIKTMFELNKRYGWSKFIIVVPSIAIREGVMKSFESMQEHFMELYGKKTRPFVYDSQKLTALNDFTQSTDLNVMIINIQAFNARTGKRIITTESDEFESRRPIDIIKAARPIIILDEPQKMGGAATQASLKEFSPLFTLNYSATHKQHHNLVYVLDAVDAYNKRLVKKIRVIGFDVKNLQGSDGYMYLDVIEIYPNKAPQARLELEISHKNGIKRETRLLKAGDDLYEISKHMNQYRGCVINDIDALRNILTFTNGRELRVGEVIGDISELAVRRAQIQRTIRTHFEKERKLYEQGVKCLSLFFIDKVSNYRKYNDDGEEINSEYGEIFEQEYESIRSEYLSGDADSPYARYLRDIDVSRTHAGYFSIDKHGHKIDSELKRGTDFSDDISAYDLILRDKELLLSFENPVRFIFSHSALREGWDNPNVFQICTLKHGGTSSVQKRQEVGRGLRLCVNQRGDRMDFEALGSQVQQVNLLTVIASEGYRNFAAALQKEIRDGLYTRPKNASPEYFTDKSINNYALTKENANAIYKYLAKNDYVDDSDLITDKYREDMAGRTLAQLPENLREYSDGIHRLIQSIFNPEIFDEMIEDGRGSIVHGNPLIKANFYKQEFQRLWSIINHKYVYTVEFESGELISKAAASMNKDLSVTKLKLIITSGTQEDEDAWEFNEEETGSYFLDREEDSGVKYDLIGKISAETKLTRRTVIKILDRLDVDKFAKFHDNPEDFMNQVISMINDQRAAAIIEHVIYNRIAGEYDVNIFTEDNEIDLKRVHEGRKSVQKYVTFDGYTSTGSKIERAMAEDLDKAKEVCVYAKLPRGFYIPTPMGNYTPDWAIAFNQGTVKHIFFVAETKGKMDSLHLNPIERSKIECAKKLFATLSSEDIVYSQVDNYENLLNIMEGN